MQTPSHFLLTAALGTGLLKRSWRGSAALLGSVAPDVPLFLLTFGGIFYYRLILGWEVDVVFRRMFDHNFYHDPFWICCHNTLHSPVVLVAALLVLWFRRRTNEAFRTSWWVWFFGSCLLHTMIDIPTHHDDGPLVLFPLDWSYRFPSPVSYWDRDHFGGPFMRFELILNVFLCCYLFFCLARRIILRRSESNVGSK